MTDDDQVWSAFSRDPRDPEQAGLRASDADRDVVHRMLAEAYADGRLDRAELDGRTAATGSARTLGDLLAPMQGLVSRTSPSERLPGSADLERRAVEAWRKDRREALWGLLCVSALVWTIWLATAFGSGGFEPYFPWPAFVTLAGLLNVGRIQLQRDEAVVDERRRLEKKQRRELERRRRDESGEDP